MTTRGPRGGVAATRGGSAGDPRPPASSANAARACLEHLCACLRALGVGTDAGATHDPTALTAETLRRAKFDQPAAAPPLWRALHDLFLVAHAGFPEPSVAAETLRSLRDEATRDGALTNDADEDETVARRRRRRDPSDDACHATHRAVALEGLRLAKYPRTRELERARGTDETTRGDDSTRVGGGSRAALVALAWTAETLDVFARAHAETRAREMLTHISPEAEGDDCSSSPSLPPFGSDAAALPKSAAKHAAPAEAAERAYLRELETRSARANDDASRRRRRARGGAPSSSSGRDPVAIEKQAACLSQRLWQSASHVHALERARAARRVAVFDAQARLRARTGEGSGRERGARSTLTATEIRLARDARARAKATAAMRAVLTTRDEAEATIALAETFWAWMRSVLELDEKERRLAKPSSKRMGSQSSSDAEETAKTTRDARVDDDADDDVDDDDVDDDDVDAATRSLEQVARRVGPVLQHRRRDVETVARMWRRTREATRPDAERSAALSALATAAAARLPSMASFAAGARAKKEAKRERTEATKASRGGSSHETVDSADSAEDASSRFSFASARRALDDVFADDARVQEGGEMMSKNERASRFGSSLLPLDESEARRGETCAEAVHRLRGSLRDAEALLEAQRARAATALRREVSRAFGNGDSTRAPAAVHGWDR